MQLSGYLAVIARWWWTILVSMWLAGLGAFVLGGDLPPTYEARARLLVGPITADIDTLRASTSLIPTFVELATSQPTLERVASQVNEDPTSLVERLTVTGNDTTRVISVRARSHDAAEAAAIANAVSDELRALQPSGTVLPEGQLDVIEAASPPAEPIAPDLSLLVVLAAAAGGVAALLLVLVIEYLNDTLRDRQEIGEITGAPILGSIAIPRKRAPLLLFTEAAPESRAATTLRAVAIKAAYRQPNEPLRRLLVLPVDDMPGSGEIAANIAGALARNGRTVTLIDADEARAEATIIMNVFERPGVLQLLESSETAGNEDALNLVTVPRPPGFDIIPHGQKERHGPHVAAIAKLLDLISARSGTVVVSAAAVQRSGSSLVWAQVCEGVILVAHRDGTKRERLRQTVESLRLVGASVLGTVLITKPPVLTRSGGQPRQQPFAVPASVPSVVTPPTAGLAATGGLAATRRDAVSSATPPPVSESEPAASGRPSAASDTSRGAGRRSSRKRTR